ncbi:MAG: hypothetical protein IJW79_00045 [Clostridia bacterium]|nr:hypothetical protein [Clostridia bacterium]
MKKFIVLVAAVMACVTLLASCAGGGAPELKDVKDELVSLIEASYEINGIFFGEGLPTYERGGSYDRKYGLYDPNEHEYAYYEYVTQESPYLFVEQIKAAAEKVYTKDYLEDVYLMAFDGYADANTGRITTARYLERGVNLMKYAFGDTDSFNILPGKRLYKFDTLEIIQPSDESFMNVSVDSYLEGDEGNILNVNLRFKKTDGGWRLDGPTY